MSALARRGRHSASGSCRSRPRLETMEDRCVPAHLIVNSPADNINQPGTLRYAVALANNGDTIDIQTTQTIMLTHGELYLAHSVTIDFLGVSDQGVATISGDHLSRIFEVAPTAHDN